MGIVTWRNEKSLLVYCLPYLHALQCYTDMRNDMTTSMFRYLYDMPLPSNLLTAVLCCCIAIDRCSALTVHLVLRHTSLDHHTGAGSAPSRAVLRSCLHLVEDLLRIGPYSGPLLHSAVRLPLPPAHPPKSSYIFLLGYECTISVQFRSRRSPTRVLEEHGWFTYQLLA